MFGHIHIILKDLVPRHSGGVVLGCVFLDVDPMQVTPTSSLQYEGLCLVFRHRLARFGCLSLLASNAVIAPRFGLKPATRQS